MLAQRSGDNRLTVLSGDIGVAGDNTDNSRHVVVIGAAGNGVHQRSDTVVDGLSIVGGNVFSVGQYSESQSGGLLCRAIGSGRVCSPTLSNVLFSGNSSVHSGGALASMAGSGGVSSPLILQSTFTGNAATNGGGAVFVWAGTASTANPDILQSSFDGNTVSGPTSFGGAVFLLGNLGNAATLISQSTFNGNSATTGSAKGGAIASYSDGGGSSVVTMTQSTLVGNSSTSGGAVHVTSSTFDVKSSIVWGNTAATGSQFRVNGGSISVDGGIVEGSCPAGVTCTGAQNLDPQLGVLAFNAGSTKTMMPGLGSPALSVPGSCSSSAVDQRDAPRPTSGSCDVGAVQRQLAAPALPTSFVAAAGDSVLALSWSPGGGDWPHYEVTDTTGGGSTAVCSTTATTCTVPGLLNGMAYTFSLVARNEAGTSGPATASGTPMTLPDAPTATAATAGNAQATVTWTAPASDGGSPILSYTVSGTPGGTCTVAAAAPRTCTIATLTNGTPYTFTVKATNAAGDSPPSPASAPVTPTAPVVVAPPAEDPGPTSTTINTPGSTTTITNPSLPVVVGPGAGAGGGTIVLPGSGTTPVTLRVTINGQPLTVQALPGTQLRIAEVNGQSVLVLVVLEGWASMTSSAVGQPMVLAGQVLLSSGSAGTTVEAQPLAVAVQVGSLTAPTGSLPAVGSMGLQTGERLQVNDQGAVVAITLGSLKGDTSQPGDPMAFANLPASITVDNKAFARLNGPLARLSGGNLAQGLEVAPSGVFLVRDGGQVFQLLPTQPITIDARLPDGMGFTPLGLLRWVRSGVVVQFAPAVADLSGLAQAVTAALPDATLKLGAEGVLQLRTGGQTYVLRPDWTGGGAATGTPQIGVDEQGCIYLQTGQGARQLLLPALLNATQASSIFTTALPGAVLAVQAGSSKGAFTVTLAGQAWRLVPQWVLPTGSAAQVPPQAGPWWIGADGLLYLKLGTQVQGMRVSD